MSADVTIDINEGVAVLTLNRPDHLNAYTADMGRLLSQAYRECDGDDDVRALVVTGAGPAFCVGADFSGNISPFDAPADDSTFSASPIDPPAFELRKPVIAALNGHALGGGAEVAVAADIRVAADDVRIGFTQVSLGIMPAWGGAERLVGLVGRSRALLAIASGTQYDAAEAHRIGLVDVVVPRAGFDASWRELAERIAALAPGTSRALKAVVAAAAPAVHEHTREQAVALFADLWAAPAHWDAVAAVTRPRSES